ncbi:MAG TPA: DUF4432 domain-containing protein [Planctomycetaceae bacterium]|nr:DUF4432 domain-containing protein [Planctomycetaceae bacterium]
MRIPLPEAVLVDGTPDLSQPLAGGTQVETAGGNFTVSNILLTTDVSEGVQLLIIESDRVRAAICPTRGMGIWKAHIDGLPCGWNSSVAGPVHPKYVPILDENGLGWLEGFDELLVRCGLQSFGAPQFDEKEKLVFPLHGRVANLPARDVSIEVDREHSLLKVHGTVRETRFMQFNFELATETSFAIDQPTIDVNDTITNRGGQPAVAEILYHINLGRPFLTQGSQLHTGSSRIVARNQRAAEGLANWNVYEKPTAGYAEQVYFFDAAGDENGWATNLLASPDKKLGFAVHQNTTTLPYVTQWKNTVAEADGYVTGIEPGTGFPNTREFEQQHDRVLRLAPGESVSTQLRMEALGEEDQVTKLAGELDRHQGKPELVEFDAKWCMQ